MSTHTVTSNTTFNELSQAKIKDILKSVAPEHPALRRVHQKLNDTKGGEAYITSYDRMHHRHSRS